MPASFTSVRVDAKLADKAVRVRGAKSRTEAVHVALMKIIGLKRFKMLMKNTGGKLTFRGSDE